MDGGYTNEMAGSASVREASRDPGLERAIQAAGGVAELARRLGIAQPSVSAWKRVPADRIVAVADATGLDRIAIRPDLFTDGERVVDEIDVARAREYALLARLTLKAADAPLLRALAGLRGDATPLGMARIALAHAAAATTAEAAGHAFFDVFIGVGRGEILPYASFYRTGFLHERPLADVRETLAALGVQRAANVFEPEDHIGTLCEVMSALAGGQLPCDDAGEAFFRAHVTPWAARLFTDLAGCTAPFYRAVGALGLAFIEIETEAFELPT
jgi:TorA maturation chaperone TorD